MTPMGSNRLLSSSSSNAAEIRKDTPLHKMAGRESKSHQLVLKKGVEEFDSCEDNEARGSTSSESDAEEFVNKDIRDDPTKIEQMTVQELRTALRVAGLSSRGRKRDLVAALKSYLQTDGQRCHLARERLVSGATESSSMARKTKKLSSHEHVLDDNTVLEASRVQKCRRRIKGLSDEIKSFECDARIVTAEQKLAAESNGVIGLRPSRSKRKLSSNNYMGEADNEVDLLVDQSEPWTIFAHKKPQKGWVAYSPRTMRCPPLTGDTKSIKLMSWNVNGLRALLKLEGLSALQVSRKENFDILCLQETKLQEKDVQSVKETLIEGYENSFWTCSASKLGYSGTAILSRIKPLSVTYGLGISDHDSEGRLVTAEFESFYLLCVYVPNSGEGLRRLTYRITEWDTCLSKFMKELEKKKPVILTGDLNCAHEEIDIYNPAGNKRSAGFTMEERESFSKNLLSRGFVDTFRKQHPNVVGYTYWGYRHGGRKTNKGWRLDYFLVSESIADKVHDSFILPDITGSDHAPIGLVLKL